MTTLNLRDLQREFKPFGILVREYNGYYQALNVDNDNTTLQAETPALLRPAIIRILESWLRT